MPFQTQVLLSGDAAVRRDAADPEEFPAAPGGLTTPNRGHQVLPQAPAAVRRRHQKHKSAPGGFESFGDPYGNRTRVSAVKGPRPRPLDEGAV